MNLNKSKIIGLAVVGLMTVGALAGCGQDQSAAKNSNEIVIGVNGALTGGTANFGKSHLQGIELAVKQQNAKGGINGKQIKLVVADNKSEASEAAVATTKLITQDKVIAILGPEISSCALAAAQIVEDNKIPLVTGTATNPTVTLANGKVRNYVFRGAFIDPFQGKVMANFATKTIKAKTAAIMVDQSSDYSKGLQKFFKETFEQLGGKVVAEESFLQKDQDFKATLTKIKAANPDIVFVPAYYEETSKIIKQARELGITAAFLGTDGWDSPKMVEIAGAENLNNTYFSNHYSPEDNDPKVVAFVDEYKKAYGSTPDALAALGYDSALMLFDALQRANSLEPEKIKDALAAIKDLQGVTGKITLDANHDPVKSAVVMEYKDGKQAFKEKINP